jgi:hypothetical protein
VTAGAAFTDVGATGVWAVGLLADVTGVALFRVTAAATPIRLTIVTAATARMSAVRHGFDVGTGAGVGIGVDGDWWPGY